MQIDPTCLSVFSYIKFKTMTESQIKTSTD